MPVGCHRLMIKYTDTLFTMNILVKHYVNAVSHYATNPCMFFFPTAPKATCTLLPPLHDIYLFSTLASLVYIGYFSYHYLFQLHWCSVVVVSLNHFASSYMLAFFNSRRGSDHLFDGLMRIKRLALVLKMMRKRNMVNNNTHHIILNNQVISTLNKDSRLVSNYLVNIVFYSFPVTSLVTVACLGFFLPTRFLSPHKPPLAFLQLWWLPGARIIVKTICHIRHTIKLLAAQHGLKD